MNLVLTITMTETGQVQVTGPIDQKLVCYGLLEIARESIAAHHAQAATRLVQPATELPLLVPGNGSRS